MEAHTCIFPEDKANSFWRLQTNHPTIIRKIKLRCYNATEEKQEKGTNWRETGKGTLHLFRKRFANSKAALNALERISAFIADEEPLIAPETRTKGFVLKTASAANKGGKQGKYGSLSGQCNEEVFNGIH